jgi:OOP family OmpA-OmpF porin
MIRTRTIVATAVLALSAIGAHAQAPAPQLTMDSGFYLGAGAGRSHSGGGCIGTCDTKDTTWQGYAGYQFNRHFAVEAGYSDFGSLEQGGTLFGVPGTVRFDTTAVEADALAIAPFTDKFSVFAKIGIFRYDTDAVASGAVIGTSSARGTEFTVGLGVQYTVWGNLAGRLEWQRYNDVGTGSPGLEKDDITVWRLSARYKF